jgi:flagellar biosynthesis protein FliP
MEIETLVESAHRNATVPLDLLVALTALALVPLLLVMCTSFVRIVVVLSLVRSAIGASALPPNAVLTGLALVLTLVVMAPTAERIRHDALDPYSHGRISPSQALKRTMLRSSSGSHAAPPSNHDGRRSRSSFPPSWWVSCVARLRSALRSTCRLWRST